MKKEPAIEEAYRSIPLRFLSIVAISFLAARAVIMNSYHWDIGGIENSVVYSASKMLYGLPLYGDPESGNFDITQYAPVYYHCLVSIAKLAGLNPMDDLHRIFLLGRGLSLAFDLLGSWLIYRTLAIVFGVDRRLSATAAILSLLTLSDFHFAVRPDSLFSLFGTMVVYFLTVSLSAAPGRRRTLFFALGMLAASLSVFVKQTGIQYVAFIPVFLLTRRMYRESILAVASISVATVSLFLIFRHLHGPFFLKNVIGGLDNGTSLMVLTDLLSAFLLQQQALFVAGAASVAATLAGGGKRTSERFIGMLANWLFVFAAVTSMKRGSWLNYYTDFLNCLIVITAVRIESVFKSEWSGKPSLGFTGRVGALFLIIFSVSLSLQNLGPKLKQHAPKTMGPYRSKVSEKRKAVAFLRAHLREGEYFLGFDRHVELMLADRAVMPNKEIIPTQVTYRYDGFYKALEDGTIRYVVVNRSTPREDFMEIDYSGFAKIYEDGSYMIFENPR